jgi:RNA polymerase sigma-70 factor (ECF subfamily)
VDSRERCSVLIEEARQGSREALDALFKEYSSYLAALVRGEMGACLLQKVEHEDLIQETFHQAIRSFHQFRGEGEEQFRSWLGAIARHVVQGFARHLKTLKADIGREVSLQDPASPARSEPGERGDRLPAGDPSPSNILMQDERFERLKRALDSLSPDHRQVIALVRLEGLPVKEVARRMGRSPNATSVLLLRALLKLKEAFGSTDCFDLPPRNLQEKEKAE